MKASITRLTETPEPPVFPIAIRKRVAKPPSATPSPKAQRPDNIFSKSRDTREDRGVRQVKTSRNPQTVPHVR